MFVRKTARKLDAQSITTGTEPSLSRQLSLSASGLVSKKASVLTNLTQFIPSAETGLNRFWSAIPDSDASPLHLLLDVRGAVYDYVVEQTCICLLSASALRRASADRTATDQGAVRHFDDPLLSANNCKHCALIIQFQKYTQK
jgi:hypothetical protein